MLNEEQSPMQNLFCLLALTLSSLFIRFISIPGFSMKPRKEAGGPSGEQFVSVSGLYLVGCAGVNASKTHLEQV